MALETFALFFDPLDYPKQYVVRRFVLLSPDAEPLYVGSSREEAEAALPRPGLYFLNRYPDDHPSVVGVWL